MGSQVAVAEVAVIPKFVGFKKLVTQEVDGSAKAGAQGFRKAFASTGIDAGKTVGTGFKKAFDQSAAGTSDRLVKQLEGGVARASRALSDARLKEQDAAGKTRIAEKQLAEARERYASDSSQVIRAEERLETASRNLARAHERTEESTDDLKRSQGELARAADRAGDELSEAGRKGISGFRENVTGGVKSFAGPLVAAFAALGIGNIVADAFTEAKDFVQESISIASDVNESVNAVQVSYGDAADAVLELGENSAKSFGLSKVNLNGLATQFSSFVKTIAGSGGDVASTLQDLVGRGTDFASVMNLDVADALDKFRSGLAGEADPLQQYGIDLSAATVQQFAYANGIAAAGTELTEAQKVQARYGALMQQTNAVAGDFVNTQDELANKNRTNAATWEDLQATIGAQFLPIAQQLATIVGDDLLPVIAKLADEQGPELAKAFADVIPELADLAEDLLPLLPGLLQQGAEAMPALLDALRVLAPLLADGARDVATAMVAFQGFFQLLNGDTSVNETVGKLLSMEGPLADIGRWAGDAGAAVGTAFYLARDWVSTRINEIVGFITGLPGRALGALGDLKNFLVQSGKDLMGGFLKGIEAMTKPIGDAVGAVMDWVSGFFPHSPADRGPFSGSGWTGLKESGRATWEQYISGMGGTGPAFPDFAGAGALQLTYSESSGSGRSYGPATVNQYNTFENIDPRHAIRQLGREAGRAFASL